ncbi:MAG: hypothetical protein ACREIP_18390 [Alphaproteobacteria bacterium]
MNTILRHRKLSSATPTPKQDGWSKLLMLADMLEVNEATGTMTLRNGKSSITLRKDGRITIEGETIVERAERRIALDAAIIDLN